MDAHHDTVLKTLVDLKIPDAQALGALMTRLRARAEGALEAHAVGVKRGVRAARAGDAERGGDFRRMDLGTLEQRHKWLGIRVRKRPPPGAQEKRESFEPARALRYGCAQLLHGI